MHGDETGVFIDVESLINFMQKKNPSINVWSKDFLWKADYAAHRNKRYLLVGEDERRSALSFLLRDGIAADEKCRAVIFPGSFDLGNAIDILAEKCGYRFLSDELKILHGIEISSDSYDEFDTIKTGIADLTGRTFKQHEAINPSKAWKVVKLLYRLTRTRKASLMQLLRQPTEKKFSLSFRNAHAFEKNQEQVWLLSDLIVYLSAELSAETIEKTRLYLSDVAGLAASIDDSVAASISETCRRDLNRATQIYRYLALKLDAFHVSCQTKPVPLDEGLHTRICSLDFAHYAAGKNTLMAKAKPNCQVNSIHNDLGRFMRKAFSDEELLDQGAGISLADSREFSLEWQIDFIELVNKALGASFPIADYEKVVAQAVALLNIHYWIRGSTGGPGMQPELIRISINELLAAICCIVYSEQFTTQHKPYWLGQAAQSGSIHFAIKFPTEKFGAVDPVPEEHRIIWDLRFEWFKNELRGWHKLTEAKWQFQNVVLSNQSEICRNENIDEIAINMHSFGKQIGRELLNASEISKNSS